MPGGPHDRQRFRAPCTIRPGKKRPDSKACQPNRLEARKLASYLASRSLSRRSFLKGAAAGAGAAVAFKAGFLTQTPRARAAQPAERHRSWVWQFPDDGNPYQIRETLAYTGMAVMLKTHDGGEFMRRWSDAPPSIGARRKCAPRPPSSKRTACRFTPGAWSKGWTRYARPASAATCWPTARAALTLDLEPKEGKNYWQAGTEEARAFGNELRRLRPKRYIIVAPDPRPWQLDAVPMAQFAAFSNEIAPQTYWNTFHTEGNRDMFASRGRFVDRADMTPEWWLDQNVRDLGQYNLPIRPIGQGAAPADEWRRFIGRARQSQHACHRPMASRHRDAGRVRRVPRRSAAGARARPRRATAATGRHRRHRTRAGSETCTDGIGLAPLRHDLAAAAALSDWRNEDGSVMA